MQKKTVPPTEISQFSPKSDNDKEMPEAEKGKEKMPGVAQKMLRWHPDNSMKEYELNKTAKVGILRYEKIRDLQKDNLDKKPGPPKDK